MFKWIKQVFLKVAGKDDKKYPIANISYRGKEAQSVVLTPYGVYHNPPANSAGLCLAAECDETILYSIFQDFSGRIKDLKEGETVVGNAKSGIIAGFYNDGTIILKNEAGENVFNSDGSVDFANGAKITNTGDFVTASGVSLDNHPHIGNLGANTSKPLPT